MHFELTSTSPPASDIGFILHKNPSRCQEFELSFGKAYVYYPESKLNKCTAVLLLDIDPINIVRGKPGTIGSGPLSQYVNDRPYVASSFLSVAIAKVYGSALQGTCKMKPDMVDKILDLKAKISMIPCRGGNSLLHNLFEPLGYVVNTQQHPLDHYPGEMSSYFTVSLEKNTTVKEVLNHLYVLIPVLDNNKHYYVGDAEVDNLLRKGENWLYHHPQRELIAKRYLKFKLSLARQALSRLADDEDQNEDREVLSSENIEVELQDKLSLNEHRIGAVLAAIKSSEASRVLDLGCGEGKLLKELIKENSITDIVGLDVSIRSLEIAQQKLGLDRLPEILKSKVKLIHGSLMYRDKRLSGFDTAVVMEVIEHLDLTRLGFFEKVLFKHAKPKTIILTTPNREYNVMWENMLDQGVRHKDHRFEWSRNEFQKWAKKVAETYNYRVDFINIGPEEPNIGSATQMGIFKSGN